LYEIYIGKKKLKINKPYQKTQYYNTTMTEKALKKVVANKKVTSVEKVVMKERHHKGIKKIPNKMIKKKIVEESSEETIDEDSIDEDSIEVSESVDELSESVDELSESIDDIIASMKKTRIENKKLFKKVISNLDKIIIQNDGLLKQNDVIAKQNDAISKLNKVMLEKRRKIINKLDTVYNDIDMATTNKEVNHIIIMENGPPAENSENSEDEEEHYEYYCMRAQKKSLNALIKKRKEKYPECKIIFRMNNVPNAMRLWNDIRARLVKEDKIIMCKNEFDLGLGLSKKQLIRNMRKVYDERLDY
jgi:hypothetical protein